MGRLPDEIDEKVRAFIEAQPMFFVATAPLAATGHVNVSPKGLDSIRVLGPRRLAYLDYVGSGSETIAHLRENGRIVLMWCAFAGPPRILRIHGSGRALEPGDAAFSALHERFDPVPASRAIICIDVERVSESCGFGVPLMTYEGQRTQLGAWAARKGEAGLAEYQRNKNRVSVDGLPALRWVEREPAHDDRG
jgi:hypothetical protein